MKKTEVLNSHISQAISTLGHYDLLTINDAGMPIPNDDKRIDVAVTKGLPRFIDVLENVLTEVEIQKIYLAEEIKTHNSKQLKAIKQLINEHVIIEFIPHSKMKEMLQSPLNKGNIRTGETTPFSNIILESNVTF
ncbi:D-ribose pyranase [Staphylococcus caprae]|uniref:D-ribose pyranase n=2 Tax=Staphylococcus TaxID=1279 RepID=A0ABN5W947_9STAP|nr:D-ribose pyranase [Staphylococcus caprae]EES41706.1 RbsD/FucU transport family protein [Staphylococcus caprae M23864:W1]MBN6826280.1 D-ribose pyranase [Staphylococcus caprae]MBU5272083.1 D-ribose pyranase [Staphylococcus caprae]MBX5323520.1 D-ribose pyranase [Staphylococcus caprae]MDI0014510.1 D-ribose pyranase [Staphylococcus caprae]